MSAGSTQPMIRDNFYIFRTRNAIFYVINTRGYTEIAWVLATSFPGSSLYLQRKDPGCGWSRDLGDKPKPQGGLLLDKILSTVQHILYLGEG